MAYQIKRVPGFGGGLNFTGHPAEIADNEWSFSNGFIAKDGYAEQCIAMSNINISAYLLANHTAADVMPHPFNADSAYVTSSSTTNVGALYDINLAAATASNITPTGGTPFADVSGTYIGTHAMLENELYISYGGSAPGAAQYGIIVVTPTAAGAGPATYTRIDQTTGAEVPSSLTAAHLEVCRDHLIAGGVSIATTGSNRDRLRSIARCDTLRGNKWVERLWNSAKHEVVTEMDYAINGLARADADTVLLFSMDRIIALRYTGANPPFTRANALDKQGSVEGAVGSVLATGFNVRGIPARTPLGVVFNSDNNTYIWSGSPQPIGTKIRPYIREKTLAGGRPLPPVWHAHLGMLVVPVRVSGSALELLYYDPVTQAWSRRVSESGTSSVAHAFIPTFSTDSFYRGRYVVLQSGGAVFREDTAATPTGFASAFVDTKDFHFEDPSSNDYIDRIAVDWEPLTNATTDQITVQAVVRDEMSLSTLGSLGGETSLSFSTQGTLTGGAGELPLRLRGKFVRFRFLVSSGRVRIRGFTIRWQRGSERAS